MSSSLTKSYPIVASSRIFAILGIFALLFMAMTTRVSSDQQPGRFTVAIIPDTQYYCDLTTGGTPEMYYDLTDWIHDRAKKDNLRFAIHLGDLVQNPDVQSEWVVADAAHKTLEWDVPYSVLPGNHDLDSQNYYNQYFGPDRFTGQTFYGGHEGTTNNNNYCFFSGGGMNFMVLNLEYNPSSSTLAWASQVVESHPHHRVIVASHEYLALTGRRTIGDRIWNKLVRSHDNIFMVVSGHVPGWHHQTSTNDAGNAVIEILTDYQWEPDGLDPTTVGGDGWLNLMEFVPFQDKIHFKSYSPYLDEWRTTALHEYTLDYAMPDLVPGDTDGDGDVDADDLATMADHWGETKLVNGYDVGDFNGDGCVNAADAALLAANWGSFSSSQANAAVPEPLVGLFLIPLLLVALAKRRGDASPDVAG